jgi:hypothetical protein
MLAISHSFRVESLLALTNSRLSALLQYQGTKCTDSIQVSDVCPWVNGATVVI